MMFLEKKDSSCSKKLLIDGEMRLCIYTYTPIENHSRYRSRYVHKFTDIAIRIGREKCSCVQIVGIVSQFVRFLIAARKALI